MGFSVVASFALLASTISSANMLPPPPAPLLPPAHTPAQLSALLVAKDYTPLGRLLAAPSSLADVKTDLDWEKMEMLAGASSVVSFWYAIDLWRLWGRTPGADDLRETAASPRSIPMPRFGSTGRAVRTFRRCATVWIRYS